jgi:hypothetical protein
MNLLLAKEELIVTATYPETCCRGNHCKLHVTLQGNPLLRNPRLHAFMTVGPFL